MEKILKTIFVLQERSAKLKLGAYNNHVQPKTTPGDSDKNDLLEVQRDDSNARQSRLSALTAKRQKR